ncbi:hypothetical protein BC829DRAFT_397300, partial [Chytridium lagenaria]
MSSMSTLELATEGTPGPEPSSSSINNRTLAIIVSVSVFGTCLVIGLIFIAVRRHRQLSRKRFRLSRPNDPPMRTIHITRQSPTKGNFPAMSFPHSASIMEAGALSHHMVDGNGRRSYDLPTSTVSVRVVVTLSLQVNLERGRNLKCLLLLADVLRSQRRQSRRR